MFSIGNGDRHDLQLMDWREILRSVEPLAKSRGGLEQLFRGYCDELARAGGRRVIVAEREPESVFAAVAAGMSRGAQVCLVNPAWGAKERAAAAAAAEGAIIFGAFSPETSAAGTSAPAWVDELGAALLIPTGGTSGALRFAVHTPETLREAVNGFAAFFGETSLHGCSLLPVFHVSGLMPWLRAGFTGGSVRLLPPREPWTVLSPDGGTVSITPTHLARWIDEPEARRWLRGFQRVLVGGAAVWPELLSKAVARGIPVVISYGMTESAAMLAAGGVSDRGVFDGLTLLPHVRARIVDEADEEAPVGVPGRIAVESAALFHGYWPGKARTEAEWRSDDIGSIDSEGKLHLLGRASERFISGGENIFPAEIEAVLRDSGLVLDVYVTGLRDSEWGEALAAFYVAGDDVSQEELAGAVRRELSAYKTPKHWIRMATLARSAHGKVDRQRLLSDSGWA